MRPMRHSILYEPPPRRVRPPKDAGNKEEEIKEFLPTQMVGRNYYLRRCKRIRWSVSESTPDELLFEILLRLPAQNIYYESRLVCRKWYHMMRTKNFIHKHLDHASYGLLYRDEFGDVVFISYTGGRINTFKLNYRTRGTIFWNSCNGLMLECSEFSYRKAIYYVANVSTDQAFRLPTLYWTNLHTDLSAIGYDAASMTYKVVVLYHERGYGYACHILTVGVDKSWRRLRTDHLSEPTRHALNACAVYTEGFLHWNRFDDTNVLTLNLETEIIIETPPPIPKVILLEEKTKSRCLTTGKYLTFFLHRGKMAWKVFEMKPETGEWRTLPDICLEGQKGTIIERFGFDVDIVPCGWLKYPEELALRITVSHTSFIIFYNLITCEIGAEKLSMCFCLKVTLHKNSLVWLGGP